MVSDRAERMGVRLEHPVGLGHDGRQMLALDVLKHVEGKPAAEALVCEVEGVCSHVQDLETGVSFLREFHEVAADVGADVRETTSVEQVSRIGLAAADLEHACARRQVPHETLDPGVPVPRGALPVRVVVVLHGLCFVCGQLCAYRWRKYCHLSPLWGKIPLISYQIIVKNTSKYNIIFFSHYFHFRPFGLISINTHLWSEERVEKKD